MQADGTTIIGLDISTKRWATAFLSGQNPLSIEDKSDFVLGAALRNSAKNDTTQRLAPIKTA
ncbi:hypothetical protein B9J09_04345 [Xylella fastidiosa subsp. pauca]|uniref:Uncharacterized protein n=1 Tax=Xylella fastidiosa (strain 9a5c) TaxID=160492 RepID=Q9PBN2_XYLFA|nr:hypothetical protein XF_2108 [Xylella fastidiosa 9a5c]ARO68373.1 hypothetical protein B9J09_04345 [Xylella fastidiosa subsp. pauca]TNW25220.1 hypothetical protein EIP74_01415 [Xylella fastidiosa subsp. pauca]